MATSVNFDKNSTEILKNVDAIHRESIINLGLSLVSKTGYYKTLTGQGSNELEEVASLEDIESDNKVKIVDKTIEKQPAKSEVNWDDFD